MLHRMHGTSFLSTAIYISTYSVFCRFYSLRWPIFNQENSNRDISRPDSSSAFLKLILHFATLSLRQRATPHYILTSKPTTLLPTIAFQRTAWGVSCLTFKCRLFHATVLQHLPYSIFWHVIILVLLTIIINYC